MTGPEILSIAMFVGLIGFLMMGFPVAFTIGGTALIFAGLGWLLFDKDFSFLASYSSQINSTETNITLIVVPIFVFMGVMLERSKIAEDLLVNMGRLFRKLPGGLAISVCLVGALLAASTGIVGATVVTMGLLALPTMLRYNYSKSLACGTIAASGTLGQIIPPSIVLVILGDQLSSSHSTAASIMQAKGDFSFSGSVSSNDLFFGALFPGLVLVGAYIVYVICFALVRPSAAPPMPVDEDDDGPFLGPLLASLLPPLLLIVAVLGSILAGLGSPTEAAAVGATMLAAYRIAPKRSRIILIGAGSLFVMLALSRIFKTFVKSNQLTTMDWIAITISLVASVLLIWAMVISTLRVAATAINPDRSFTPDSIPRWERWITLFFLMLLGLVLFGLALMIELQSIGKMDLGQLPYYQRLVVGTAVMIGIVVALLVHLKKKREGRWAEITILSDVVRQTLSVSVMIFTILIGARLLTQVFRQLDGAELVEQFLQTLPGGAVGAILLVLAVMFFLGFILDFLEIIFIVVPIVTPVILTMKLFGGEFVNPVWLGVMMAVVLQTSFLTPPFGFALFYLRGVAPSAIKTMDIYKGVVPFILIQVASLGLLWYWPELASWLPLYLFGK